MRVARPVRAWIETCVNNDDIIIVKSHALCVRGLKHNRLQICFREC